MENSSENILGKGRSATVYAGIDGEGRCVATKVFVGSTLAGLVHYLLFGANNPYIWSRPAIEEAACRRRILALLVQWWFPSRLRVAKVFRVTWNDKFQVNEMAIEFIDGRGASLHHAFSELREPELRDLIDNVMKPLQSHLIEAGFDGSAWQAGLGNPVALSNFLLEQKHDGQISWVWIDIESGVPALFPLNPIVLWRFYVPRSLFYKRPLFDDVNVPQLEAYIDEHKDKLAEVLGPDSWELLCREIEKLAHYQKQWRSMTRLDRSIQARLHRGEISGEQATWYTNHPMRWYTRELVRGVCAAAERVRTWVSGWLNVTTLQWVARGVANFVLSAQFRADLARKYVALRIEKWSQRRQLHRREADYLIRELHRNEASFYITDFGVHIAIKPFVKAITWFVLPFLYAIGVINEPILVTGVVAGGSIGRTIYTFARVVGTTVRGVPKPWIAFLVGMVPVIGNAAFPLQLIYESTDRDNSLAKFILYDVFARVGEAVPIWGGEDTLIEHRLNQLGDFVVRQRSPLAGDGIPLEKQRIKAGEEVIQASRMH